MAKLYNRLAEINRASSLTTNDNILVEQGNVVVRVPANIVSQQIGGNGQVNLANSTLLQVNENKEKVSDLQSKTARLNDILGLYSDRASLTLSTTATGAQNGKAIVPAVSGSMYGKVEAMTGACVSKEFQLTRGDLLLIKPGKTSNDVFTVAQVLTSSDGTKSYSKAPSLDELTEVPTDGWLRFLVMPADMTVCITFFASEAAFSSEVKVMRCGSFASICAQASTDHSTAQTDHENYTADRATFVQNEAARQATFNASEAARTATFNSKEAERDAAIASVTEFEDDVIALIGAVKATPDYAALPLLCGQPPILYGAGTPQEAVVPMNWNQYDPETDEGYNWNGQPSAIGQQYINTSASSGGRYVAVPDGNGGLTWKNF